MSDTISLADLTTALAFETGIDGQVLSSGRHPTTTWLYPLLNRTYKELRSLVSQHGEEFFRTSSTSTAIPARAAGEDWIELTFPTDATEIIGVDVQLAGTWYELVHGSFAQRRVWPGPNRCDSPGEWTTLSMPQPSTTTVTAGKIVIWPPTLSGNYKIHYLPKWTALTDDTHVFVIFPDWLEWLLAKAALVIIQRDNNKKNAAEIVMQRLARAQGAIIAHARRSRRGTVVARRRDGNEL